MNTGKFELGSNALSSFAKIPLPAFNIDINCPLRANFHHSPPMTDSTVSMLVLRAELSHHHSDYLSKRVCGVRCTFRKYKRDVVVHSLIVDMIDRHYAVIL